MALLTEPFTGLLLSVSFSCPFHIPLGRPFHSESHMSASTRRQWALSRKDPQLIHQCSCVEALPDLRGPFWAPSLPPWGRSLARVFSLSYVGRNTACLVYLTGCVTLKCDKCHICQSVLVKVFLKLKFLSKNKTFFFFSYPPYWICSPNGSGWQVWHCREWQGTMKDTHGSPACLRSGWISGKAWFLHGMCSLLSNKHWFQWPHVYGDSEMSTEKQDVRNVQLSRKVRQGKHEDYWERSIRSHFFVTSCENWWCWQVGRWSHNFRQKTKFKLKVMKVGSSLSWCS